MKDVDGQYAKMLEDIMRLGTREVNARTGQECCSLPGLTFQVDQAEHFPLVSLRRIPVKNFVAEQMWFLSGSDDVRWLSQKTKIWDSFAEPNGVVTGAYGRRWRNWFRDMGNGHAVDQLEVVMDKLKTDPSTRHGVVMMWDPGHDLIYRSKNVPCPYTFTLMVIGGRLHMHLTVRSNDMVLGFPTDAAGFGLLQRILAQELGVEPGVYTHSISNAHVYQNHYYAADLMVDRNWTLFSAPIGAFELPKDSYRRATALDEALYEELKASLEGVYRPMAQIPGLVVSV